MSSTWASRLSESSVLTGAFCARSEIAEMGRGST